MKTAVQIVGAGLGAVVLVGATFVPKRPREEWPRDGVNCLTALTILLWSKILSVRSPNQSRLLT